MAKPKNTVTAFQEFLQRPKVVELLMEMMMLPKMFDGQANLLEASLANDMTSNPKTVSMMAPNNPQPKNKDSRSH